MLGQFSKGERALLLILASVQFSHIVDFMLMMPLGPQLMRLMEISAEEFSLLVSAYTFWAGVSSLLSAFFLDRFDRKRMLVIFFFGFALGTIACGLAPNYITLMLARSLTGIFGGVLGSLVFSIIGDVFAPEKRGSATGIIMGAFSIASIFGVPFSLYLAAKGSWHTPLLVLGAFSLVLAVAISIKAPALTGHMGGVRQSTWSFLKSLPTQRRPSLAILLLVAIMLGQFSVISFLSTALVGNAGVREDQLSLTYLVGGIVSLFSSPFFGRMCDKVGAVRVLLFCTPLSIVGFIAITNLGAVGLYWALVVMVGFFITMGGRMVPTMTLVTGSVLPRNRGAFMSLTTALQQFAAASAAMIAGKIVVNGPQGELLHYPAVGYFAAVLSVLAFVIAYSLRREPAQVAATEGT